MTALQTTRRTLLSLIGSLSVFRPSRGSAADTFTLVPALAAGQVLRYHQVLRRAHDGVVVHHTRSTVALGVRERVAGGWLVALLAPSLLKEPAILLGAMGHDYRIGQPWQVRTRIPSPLGAGEIPVLGRYQVHGIAAGEPRADIGWLMVIDRASAAHAVGAGMPGTVRRMEAAAPATSGQGPQPVAASTVAEAAAGLDFDDRGHFIIDTTTAWPVSVRHQRRVSAGGSERVDTVELTRVGG